MKYRKKPVIIEAYQTDKDIIIPTLEGYMKASVGDYIITGVNGEKYSCKPDIFEKTYDPVPMTNYDRIKDRIKAMNVRELAQIVMCPHDDEMDYEKKYCSVERNCILCKTHWLESEAEK